MTHDKRKSTVRQPGRRKRLPLQPAALGFNKSAKTPAIYASARLLAIALLMCGALFVGSGPAYLQRTTSAASWLEDLRALPSEISHPRGTRLAIDGLISEDNVASSPPFVAYVRETKRGSGSRGGSSWWVEEDRHRAAFSIRTTSAKVVLTSTEYKFTPQLRALLPGYIDMAGDLIADWDHAHLRHEASPDGSVGYARLRGLAIGQPVLVIGRMVEADRIIPEYVMAGTRQSIEARVLEMAHGNDDATGYAFMMAAIATALAALLAWLAYVAWIFRQRPLA